jgi:molybdate transport system substrate-binding protein
MQSSRLQAAPFPFFRQFPPPQICYPVTDRMVSCAKAGRDDKHRRAFAGGFAMTVKTMAAAAVGLAVAMGSGAAAAADVTALISNALKSSFEELGPQFEKASGHKLKATFGTTEPLKVRIEKGEAIDLAVIGDIAIDDLIKQGKLVASTRVIVTRSGLGVAVRKGAPKPDLSTADAFKRAMIDAQSIGFNERGLTGTYLWSLFERLGITAVVKSKFKHGSGAELVAKGEAEIGMTQASEIVLASGADLAGLLPAEIQNYTVFPGAISASAAQPDAAKALFGFLASPDAHRVMKAKGLTPPG